MKTKKITLSLLFLLAIILSASVVTAGDFDWIKDFNIRAEADRNGFRARLATRFHIGDAEVNVVLGNVGSPADAYMVLRLGEMSSKPVGYVLNKYKTEKNKGWGALAHSLGIKPGSKEFHALKKGSDIYENTYKSKGNKKSKSRG
jgi:hypothetical protein